MVTVVVLVILRLALGCHFFYEGVWKIKHAEQFSAEPFLTQAKGPFAPLFYALVGDIDGKRRLRIQHFATAEPVVKNWRKAQADSVIRFRRELEKQNKTGGEAEKQKLRELTAAGAKLLCDSEKQLDDFIAANNAAMVSGKGTPDQVKSWVGKIGEMERAYYNALGTLIEEKTAAKKPAFTPIVPKGKDNVPLAAVVSVKRSSPGTPYLDKWYALKDRIESKYALDHLQQGELAGVFLRYKQSLRKYLDENRDDIAAYFGSLERFEHRKSGGNNGAAHQKQRTWSRQQELRREVRAWLGELDQMQEDFGRAAWNLLSERQKSKGDLPVAWTAGDLTNLAVTWGLTAIGFCLLLGLFTRPAALGGAAFMTFVLMTQPPWPTIYPPAPDVVGHALLVDKNFIELVALLAVASCAVGRWGGLDYFVEHYAVKLFGRLGCPLFRAAAEPGETEQYSENPQTEKEGQ